VGVRVIAIAIDGISAKIIAINCNYLQLFTQIYNEMQLLIAKFLIIAIIIA